MARNGENNSASVNLIGTGTVITGDVKSNGDLRIDGTLIGSIFSKGKVVVGPTGEVEGELVGVEPGDIKGGGIQILSKCIKVL